MRTNSYCQLFIISTFLGEEERRVSRKGGGKGAMALLELSCLFFFISIRLLFSIPPYGVRYSKCGVSIIWTLLRDHAPSVRCAARITHWHWQFSCNTDIFSHRLFFLFYFFDLSSIPALLATCSLITRIYYLRYSRRESIYIYPFTFIATSESINNVISKFYIISTNLITMKIFRYAEKFIFVKSNFYHFFFFLFFPANTLIQFKLEILWH